MASCARSPTNGFGSITSQGSRRARSTFPACRSVAKSTSSARSPDYIGQPSTALLPLSPLGAGPEKSRSSDALFLLQVGEVLASWRLRANLGMRLRRPPWRHSIAMGE